MKNKTISRFSFLLAVGLVMSGCGASQFGVAPSHVQQEPEWILNPNKGIELNRLAASSCVYLHINGEKGQQKSAYNNAISQIAAQKLTKVSSVSLTHKDKVSSSHVSTSMQQVEEVKVSGEILAIFKRSNGELCMWVAERK